MRRLYRVIILLLGGAVLLCTYVFAWEIQKSDHFIVNYKKEVPLEYVNKIAEKAESYYDSITTELGFTRYEGFWTWDERAKIYLYKDKDEYIKIIKKPWSGAEVNVITREIHAYVNMENFIDIILPHELSHIIFREFIGFRRELPLWLDEGISSYLEKKEKQERLIIAKTLVKTKRFMPLSELNEVKRGSFVVPDIFYAESASIIEFLVQVYGKEKFVEFCRRLRELRKYQNWEVALKDTYDFKDLLEMNERWVKFLLR